jgi:hypothetical protein
MANGSQFILCAHCFGNYSEGGSFTRTRDGRLVHRRCIAAMYEADAMGDAKKHVAEREARGDQRAAFEKARAKFITYPHMLRDLSKYKPG